MRRTIVAALAATVALPMMAIPASAQQDRGYGYGSDPSADYRWSERRGMIERDRWDPSDAYAGPGEPPNPPRTPNRYVTDWDQTGQGRDRPDPPYTPDRYITDWDDYRADRDRRRYGDDRWADRNPPRRSFDRPSPPPGYYGEPGYPSGGYGRDTGPRYADDRYGGADRGSYDRGYPDERGDPYADQGWGAPDERDRANYRAAMRERMHREMMARHHGSGYQDRDFRRDFAEDGRRGYYQDPSYEQMPRGRQGMGGQRDRMGARDAQRMRRAMRMIDRFDVDKDGRVTQREIDQYRSDRLSQFDADSDEQLTLDEYSELWADAMRERMVRRFQRHDRDGDGLVTTDEFAAATRDMVRMRDRNRDDTISEDDFMRPEVAAPIGGRRNEPAESRVEGDDDIADYETRPEVEAPMESGPDEPAGTAADADEGPTDEEENTPEATDN